MKITCPTTTIASAGYGPHSDSGVFYRIYHFPRLKGDRPFYVCENHINFYRGSYCFEIGRKITKPPAEKFIKGVAYAFPEHSTAAARFSHPDRCCTYLGRFNEYDLYYCEGPFTKTVLARYSNEPSEYLSGWGSRLAPLMIAENLAYRRNLVSKGRIG